MSLPLRRLGAGDHTRTSVCKPSRPGGYRSGRLSGRDCGRAVDPGCGIGELRGRRESGGPGPDPVQGRNVRLGDNRVAERLSKPVLAKLQLETEEPRDRLAEAAA